MIIDISTSGHYTGDCRDLLARLPERCVQTCVTSPPYWGLRDYGVDGQIGLERTPEEYVAAMVDVFRGVRRALRDDGTLWLNLGDSYAGSRSGPQGESGEMAGRAVAEHRGMIAMTKAKGCDPKNPRKGTGWNDAPNRQRQDGLKPKDLVGIPWAVAQALRAPYYAGRITAERDRVWMAAMIDGEGTICGFEHTRADDGSVRTGLNLCITNTNIALLDEAARIWPTSRAEHCSPGDGHLGTLPSMRWLVHGAENKALFLREIYPYLVAKRKQAVLGFNLALLMMDAKKLGHSPQRDEIRAKRSTLVDLMSDANHARTVDVPTWCTEPPSVCEPGWYLRSEIIWHKPNPMPESVTDRPTKSHEHVFLLAKSARYYYDFEAIAEPAEMRPQRRLTAGPLAKRGNADRGPSEQRSVRREPLPDGETRNKRDVWTIATEPFDGAHFAVMPPGLVEPCILAGSRAGDIVLDPFFGSGTTGMVAEKHGRRWIGFDLNPEYEALQRERTAQRSLLGRMVP